MDIRLESAFEHKNEVRALFKEYLDMVVENEPGFKDYLALQNIDDEISHLEHKYSSPEGRLYVLFCDNKPAGCVGLKKFDEFGKCEIKRLYVKPEFRGHKLGTFLTEKIIEDARKEGYKEMYLDTFSFLKSALKLYKSLGFYEVESYNNSPMDNLIYLRYDL